MKKGLGETWQVFRFTLRATAVEHARGHVDRIATLPLEPADPQRLAPVVNGVLAEIERSSVADEASPVLRALRRIFRPSPEERSRRKLKKAFEAYSSAWRARPAG